MRLNLLWFLYRLFDFTRVRRYLFDQIRRQDTLVLPHVESEPNWCMIKVVEGRIDLYTPDGQLLPRQLDCQVEQLMSEAKPPNRYAIATIRLWVKLEEMRTE